VARKPQALIMFELCLQVTEDAIENLSDALIELGALSVSVEDADAHTEQENAKYGEPGMPTPPIGWSRSVVIALFEQEQQALDVAQWLVGESDWANHASVDQIRPLVEQDWVRLTQSQFDPVQITEQFWIVPTWHDLPGAAEKVLRLDPGLAFGTGSHPTTKMCLKWIAGHAPVSQRVLDYGCGSGILAMGAALYGAAEVDAVDIDPAAVDSTVDNARANQLGHLIHAGLPEKASGQYDTVMANILASPLKVLAPLLVGHMKEGASLVLAGILERQAQELMDAYAPYCELRVLDQLDGWILMGAGPAHSS
jgi:ribosomal protein L11 methyltransferase